MKRHFIVCTQNNCESSSKQFSVSFLSICTHERIHNKKTFPTCSSIVIIKYFDGPKLNRIMRLADDSSHGKKLASKLQLCSDYNLDPGASLEFFSRATRSMFPRFKSSFNKIHWIHFAWVIGVALGCGITPPWSPLWEMIFIPELLPSSRLRI